MFYTALGSWIAAAGAYIALRGWILVKKHRMKEPGLEDETNEAA